MKNYGTVDNEKWHPVGYLSQALQDYQKHYLQTETEILSIVFGVKHFHEYLYGHRFIVINDNKPFKSILNRSIIPCPPSIQKFFLRLQKYDIELQYSLGKDMLVSANLSRSHLSCSEPEFNENSLSHYVRFALSNLPISETCLKQFQLETRNEPILQTLITHTAHECPEKLLIPTDLLLYYTHRSDATVCERILLKNERIIVPTALGAEMKSLIHQGHL